MQEFHLFRLKAYPPEQLHVFQPPRKPSEVLKETILSRPSAWLRKDMMWHIGNVANIDETGLYMRIGRTTKLWMEKYQDGDFVDELSEVAPSTHLIVDLLLELCAIAKKPKLSPTVPGIARQFVKLLNASEKACQLEANFEISALNDPEDFIAHLRGAYGISKFAVAFSKPNAWDVEQDWHLPMERLLRAIMEK